MSLKIIFYSVLFGFFTTLFPACPTCHCYERGDRIVDNCSGDCPPACGFQPFAVKIPTIPDPEEKTAQTIGMG